MSEELLRKRAKDGDEVYVCVVTKGKSPLFNDEFIEQGRKECRKADKKLGVKETIFLDFSGSDARNSSTL